MISKRITITENWKLVASVATRGDSRRPFLNWDLRNGITWCDFADREAADRLRDLAALLDLAWAELDQRNPTEDKAII